jgi:acyl-CoA thioester hydrolase
LASVNFEWGLRVRYQETDQQGIVYHSRYLEYCDIAMTEFFRWLGWDYPDFVAAGCDPSLVTTAITFHAPARCDEIVAVRVSVVRIGNKSFTLGYYLHRGGTKLVTVETVYVNIDPTQGTSRDLPEHVRMRMMPLLLET